MDDVEKHRGREAQFTRNGIDILVTFRNYGKTPAWIVEHSFFFGKISESTNRLPLKYDEPELFPHGVPVPPGKRFPTIRKLIMIDADLIGRPDEGIYVFYGYLKYRDVFYGESKIVRETRIRMRYERTQDDVIMDRPGQWVYDGTPEDNQHT